MPKSHLFYAVEKQLLPGGKKMTEHTHTPIESVADAHKNSNLVILRFSSEEVPSNSGKHHHITRNLGMQVTIVKMGPGAIVDT
jgi:hypothetical protein